MKRGVEGEGQEGWVMGYEGRIEEGREGMGDRLSSRLVSWC